MADETSTPDPAPVQTAAPTSEPAAPSAPLTSKAHMDRMFNEALSGIEARNATPSTDEPAAEPTGEAKPGDEKSEAETEPGKKTARRYDFGGQVGEIEEGQPLAAGQADKLQAELRGLRKGFTERSQELAAARKELEASKAAKPEPAQADPKPTTPAEPDDVEEIKADLLETFDIDEASAERLARRFATRKADPAPNDDPRITAALARLERMEAILGDDLDAREAEQVRSEATAHVAAHVKETHGVDLAPEQVEAVRDRAQELLDAAKIPDGTPDAAAEIIVRQCVDLAFAQIGKAEPAPDPKNETKKPNNGIKASEVLAKVKSAQPLPVARETPRRGARPMIF